MIDAQSFYPRGARSATSIKKGFAAIELKGIE